LSPSFPPPTPGIEEMREALLESGVETALLNDQEVASLYALLVNEHYIPIGRRPAA
jgi:hypothetical protein